MVFTMCTQKFSQPRSAVWLGDGGSNLSARCLTPLPGAPRRLLLLLLLLPHSAQDWLPGAGCHLPHWRWSSRMLAAAACPPRLKACLRDPQAFFPVAPHQSRCWINRHSSPNGGPKEALSGKTLGRLPRNSDLWEAFPGPREGGTEQVCSPSNHFLGTFRVPRMVLGVKDTAVGKQDRGTALMECPF